MDKWICHTECYAFSHHWQPGDICESDEHPGKHFTKYVDGIFPATGRRIGVVNGRAYRIEDE